MGFEFYKESYTGKIKEIPVSAVTRVKNNSGFSAIKHKDARRKPRRTSNWGVTQYRRILRESPRTPS